MTDLVRWWVSCLSCFHVLYDSARNFTTRQPFPRIPMESTIVTHFVIFVIYVLFEKILSGPANEAISHSYFMFLVSICLHC